MNKLMWRPAVRLFVILTVLTGVAYPLLVTAVAMVGFPRQATGSFLERDGRRIGSELVSQPFQGRQYFWGRLSATAGFPSNAQLSGGSNFGPLHPSLADAVQARLDALRAADPRDVPVPIDLVTASASGLDPHISPAAADYQVRRVAAARGMSEQRVRGLVREATEGRQWGMLGEPRVNVLQLNLALDEIAGDNGETR